MNPGMLTNYPSATVLSLFYSIRSTAEPGSQRSPALGSQDSYTHGSRDSCTHGSRDSYTQQLTRYLQHPKLRRSFEKWGTALILNHCLLEPSYGSKPPTHINTNPWKRKKKGRREKKRGEWHPPSQIFMQKVTGSPRRNVDLAANTLLKENTKMS